MTKGHPKPEPEPSDDSVEEAAHQDPEPDFGEYFIGYWHEFRNYGCPHCPYATLEGPGAVNSHILERHLAQAPTAMRPAGILGPDGRPL